MYFLLCGLSVLRATARLRGPPVHTRRHGHGTDRRGSRGGGGGAGLSDILRGLSFVLQRDDILADDAAVAPKLGHEVALGENPGELHRALAARAAGGV